MAMNLIPETRLKELYDKRLLQLMWYVAISLTSLTAIGLVLIAPSYILLTYQSNELQRSVEVLRNSESIQKVQALEETTNQYNTLFRQYVESVQSEELPSVDLENITAGAGQAITIQYMTLNFTDGALTVNGTAKSRAALSGYLDELKKNPSYEEVTSPLDQRLEEEGERKFLITIHKKKNK